MSDGTGTKTPKEKKRQRIWGMLAEFETERGIIEASREVRDAGYVRWDTHTPYPVHGLDAAMGLRATILPWIVLIGGITGAVGALAMQIWMNGIDYPFLVSGKPYYSIPAFIPITFELTVLLSAISAFGAMLGLNGLPRFYHPLDRSECFRRATTDRFFILIEAKDPRFSEEETRSLLESIGASTVERLEG